MNTNSIDQVLQTGKKPVSRLLIAFAASLILIGCSSSDSDEPTVSQGETTAPVEQTDASQEQVDTPEQQGETTAPIELTDTPEEQADTPVEQVETPVNTDSPPSSEQLPSAVQAELNIASVKTLRFTWEDVASATHYRLLENADGISGFTQVGQDIQAGVETIDHIVALYKRTNASYVIQSCNAADCIDSDPLFVSGTLAEAIGYIKASNTDGNDLFGVSVSLSADGNTMAVGAISEDSNATGVNGDQTDNTAGNTGAVYVFARIGSLWEQQAYIKASNTGSSDGFGGSVSLSADGNTLAVAAQNEGSSATGINGDQVDDTAGGAGAVYVFTRTGSLWGQQAYIKASNTSSGDQFGGSVSLSADGNTLAVGANGEASSATGVNGNQTDNSVGSAGAVYVFTRIGSLWEQQAYIKANNAGSSDVFGSSVSLSSDGNTLAITASGEASSATGINGDQTDNSTENAGAVYVFTRSGSLWEQQVYIKASNTNLFNRFGSSASLSADGNTLAVGATSENSGATGINGDQDQANNTVGSSGAVYVFTRNGSLWEQQAYVKASNTGSRYAFGVSVSLSADGNTLAVGALNEASSATGINGEQTDNSTEFSGAVYGFTRSGSFWEQQAYIKASNTDSDDQFGGSVSLSADGNTLAVGANGEASSATGINGDQADNSTSTAFNTAGTAGAVYLY